MLIQKDKDKEQEVKDIMSQFTHHGCALLVYAYQDDENVKDSRHTLLAEEIKELRKYKKWAKERLRALMHSEYFSNDI